MSIPDSGLLVQGYLLINRESYAHQHRAKNQAIGYCDTWADKSMYGIFLKFSAESYVFVLGGETSFR